MADVYIRSKYRDYLGKGIKNHFSSGEYSKAICISFHN